MGQGTFTNHKLWWKYFLLSVERSSFELGVQSQSEMGRIGKKTVGVLLPLLTDEFKGRKSFQRLEALGRIVCHQESRQMLTKLLMGIVVVAIDRRLFEGAVHALHLSICPRMVGFGQPMLDPLFGADAVKQQRKSVAVSGTIGKLDAVVR